jgi:enoyl-CoA hydratase
VNATHELSLAAGQTLEAELFGRCCKSEDFKEGTTAFLEKRKPVFKNK